MAWQAAGSAAYNTSTAYSQYTDDTYEPGGDSHGAINKSLGVLLILVASIAWGAYGGVRKHFAPSAENVPFMVNQQLAQFVFALLVVLPQWNSIQTHFTMTKFLFVFFAGMTTLLAEFLYLAATKHLSSTAAMACFALPSDCFVSIIIDQCIQSYGVKLKYLVVAATLYLIGEGFFILVDYTYEKEAWRQYETWRAPAPGEEEVDDGANAAKGDARASASAGADGRRRGLSAAPAVASGVPCDPESGGSSSGGSGGGGSGGSSSSSGGSGSGSDGGGSYQHATLHVRGDEATEPLIAAKDKDGSGGGGGAGGALATPLTLTAAEPEGTGGLYVCFWVTVALFGGMSLGLFTILSSIGMTGEGAITDPGTALIIMQTGQTLGLPFIIFIFGFWDPFDMMPPHERVTRYDRRRKCLCVSVYVCLCEGVERGWERGGCLI